MSIESSDRKELSASEVSKLDSCSSSRPKPLSSLIGDFPVAFSVAVQWGDMDALGHVNNTVPVRWYESSRIAYLEKSGIAEIMGSLNVGAILAAVSCNYRRQLFYPDQVHVGCRASKLGRSSFTLQHAVVSEGQNEVAADGESVVVVLTSTSKDRFAS